jgi:alkanesulfonate monooxygenase SsuD/methylene tetrahydromethanopterin reductase-like flavin-dependent oxidoreductase (luciferase family)
MEREHRAFAFPFPATSVRMAMFAEQLEIVHRLWTEEHVDFQGEHYTLENAPGLPKPVQRPHPPIIVGGGGSRGTAEPAARFADEYNTPFKSPEEFAEVRAKVSAACERIGRDPATMRFSLMTGCVFGETREPSTRTLVGSVDEIAARLREYEAAGCERVMLQHLAHADLEPVRLIGRELAPAVA